MISVIFDMDGTLLDTQRIFIPAWNYAGSIQGITGVGENIALVCGMNEIGWSGFLVNKYKNLDLDKFKKDATEYIVKNGKIAFKKGARELIDFLKENKIKIAIASGSSKELIMYNLNALGCPDEFDVIVGGDEVEKGKPAPDIFLLAAKRLGEAPSDCIVFEDSKNGIIAGNKAGMKCIGVPDVAEFDYEAKKLMIKEISSLDEGIDIIKKF